MKIEIQFTVPLETKLPLSRLIRWVEGTDYSHVRLCWTNSVGIEIVYEASGSSVKFKGPLAQQSHPVHVIRSYKLEISKEQYKKLVVLCMKNAGVDYGIMQLIGIGVARLFGLKHNPFSRGQKRQVCSEVVGRFLQEVMGIGKSLDLDTVSPKDIEDVLIKELK